MSNKSSLYDDNTRSPHGPSGVTKQVQHGPYGGKDNQHQLSARFAGEKTVKPVPKP